MEEVEAIKRPPIKPPTRRSAAPPKVESAAAFDRDLQRKMLRAKLKERIAEKAGGRVSKQARAAKAAQAKPGEGAQAPPPMTREDFVKEMEAAGGNTDAFMDRMGFSEEVRRLIKAWERQPNATDPKVMEKYTEKIIKLAKK